MRNLSTADSPLLHRMLAYGLLLLIGPLSGCTALQPFPNAVRAGGTVMLAVGSPDGMTRANSTVQYVSNSDPGNPVDLTPGIRSIFKVYPDRTSAPWLANALTDGIPLDTGHGAWLTVMAVDLPASLFPGTGVVQVTTSATVGSAATDINSVDIPLEILPGIGQPHQFPYEVFFTTRTGNLIDLEPMPQVVIRPPIGGNTPTYGAIEVKLNVPMINNDGTPATDSSFTIVVDDMGRTHHLSQLQTSWVRKGDEITVIFVSPTGTMKAWETRCAVVIFPNALPSLNIPGTMIDPSKPAPSLVSIQYYDVNGVAVTGPSPTVTVEDTTI